MDPFLWKYRVEFRDTDAAGIAHFSTYFTMMERAEHAWLREMGYSVVMPRDGYTMSWPRVAAECHYDSPLRFEETVQLAGTIKHLGRSSVCYAFHFRCGERQIATGSLTAVCCRVVHGEKPESMEIPADLRQKLADYVDER